MGILARRCEDRALAALATQLTVPAIAAEMTVPAAAVEAALDPDHGLPVDHGPDVAGDAVHPDPALAEVAAPVAW